MPRYYKVWDINVEQNSAIVKLSRSRKVRDNDHDKALTKVGVAKNGYITDFSDSYVRFVGKAFNQLSSYDIKLGDTIYAEIDISNEAYIDSNGEIAYPKGYKHTVYEFSLPDSTGDGTPAKAPKNIDRAPRVDEEPKNYQEDVDDDSDPF